MYGIIFRYRQSFVALVLSLILSIQLSAGEKDSSRSLKFIFGAGYGYYFNTIKTIRGEKFINVRPSFSGKLMWQPEYRVRIGIESGYYEFYSDSRIESGNNREKYTAKLNVVPLFLSFAMKMAKHIDINFATGGALLNFRVISGSPTAGMVRGETLSLSDFAGGVTWHTKLGSRFEAGSEIKYLYLGKTGDSHLSMFLNLGYKIIGRKVK